MNRKTEPIVQKIIKAYQKRSIQLIISISFTTIAIASMGFMGIALYTKFVENTKNTMIKNNEQLLDQTSWNLNLYLRNMMSISNTMYYSVIKNKDLTRDSLDKEMNLLYEANKDNLISIACFTEDGALLAASPVAARKEGVDVIKQDWFLQAEQKIENLHFSTPHVQDLFESSNYRYYWVVSLSRAVELTYMGNITKGILLVDTNFSSIEQLFSKVNEKEKGYVYLMDGNGNLIYHPKKKVIYSHLLKENNMEAAMYEDGSHMETFEGEKRAVVVKTVGYTGWKIVSVTPIKEFSPDLNQYRFFVILISSVTIFMILFGNIFISSKVTNPIRKLENSVKDLENGNLNLTIYAGGSHEIQHLGRTINFVVKQIQKLMQDIVKEQEEKRKSELDALQSQINPHFLYNTLDSIVWMIESERHQEAISMVTALARLFRISLSKGKNIIPIQDEIQHAENYLSIQKMRYKNKFTCTVWIAPEIEKCNTIKLIVQPLLENAIYYGVEHMDGEGEIIIWGYEKNGDVYLEVRDNGLGMPKETVDCLLTDDTRVRKKGSGVGLCNVHQRIQLYYGEAYGLEIESELDVGTTVRIHLPKVMPDQEEGVGHETK